MDGDSVNVSRHLGVVGRVNLGSFYTPARYVRLASEWLLAHGIGDGWTIADLSCGYGAFFELSEVEGLQVCRYVGNDIDHDAVEKAKTVFPNVRFCECNALVDVSREKFGIGACDKLVIVGNPPYNDVTSQINQSIKTSSVSIDSDLTRLSTFRPRFDFFRGDKLGKLGLDARYGVILSRKAV